MHHFDVELGDQWFDLSIAESPVQAYSDGLGNLSLLADIGIRAHGHSRVYHVKWAILLRQFLELPNIVVKSLSLLSDSLPIEQQRFHNLEPL